MEGQSVKLTVWDRQDPLDPFIKELMGRLEPLVRCRLEKGGGRFRVYVDGKEAMHFADYSLYHVENNRSSSPLGYVKQVFKWLVSYHPGPQMLQVRRHPDPDVLTDSYSLLIRISYSPEIEDAVVEVCEKFQDAFKDGIYIFSERTHGRAE